jgi:hypothetical protein
LVAPPSLKVLPSKEANGRRKADCSREAEHANGLQTGRNGQGHQDLGRLVHPNCVALLSAPGGLGQEVDRAGFDGSPHCPGPLPIFPAIALSWHPAFQLVALGINHVGRGI